MKPYLIDPPTTGRIAVKVINHYYGDESLKVITCR